MVSITTRAGKGSPLTHAEVDANFNNLNSGKLDISAAPAGSVTVDSSGRVGIGTTILPGNKLTVGNGNSSPDSAIVKFNTGDTNVNALILSNWTGSATNYGPKIAFDNSARSTWVVGSEDGGGAFIFKDATTGNNERLRIDSSGRLLVGTSSSRVYTSLGDLKLQVEGTSWANSSIGATNNQATVDGAYIALAKTRGTSVGSLTSVQSGDLLGSIWFQGADGTALVRGGVIECVVDGTPGTSDMPGRLVFSTTADGASSPTERLRIQSDGKLIKYGDSTSARIQPQTDNAGYLGEASFRWQAVYAVNGTIQTSDVREKTEIVDSPLGSDFIRALRPVAYKWKIGGYTSTYDEDGKETITPNPGVRVHYGFIAQEVKQAIGTTDFGGWLQEDLNDPESQQSLRLHEFISPIVKALQEALEKIETLETKVAALEASS